MLGEFQPQFVMRSPVSVYSYLGKLLRDPPTFDKVLFYTIEAGGAGGQNHHLDTRNGYMLDIVPGGGPLACQVSVNYRQETYCVPYKAQVTSIVMDILQELRNLSIQPTDLNEAFTVRVSQ